jgi:arginase family enzyme
MRRILVFSVAWAMVWSAHVLTQSVRYTGGDGKVRVALAQQPFSPTATVPGPRTMAEGGIQQQLAALGATVRVDAAALTPDENTEYGGWKRLGMALGHFADIVAKNERDGYFTVGLLATCPSMPGLVAGLQHSGPTREPIRIGMLWLDAHPDFNTPETTRSGSLGGMPVAVATGRALQRLRLDARLDPPMSDPHIVMGGVRLIDPLEQQLLGRLAHPAADGRRSAARDTGGVRRARSAGAHHRQDLRPHRHGRARRA